MVSVPCNYAHPRLYLGYPWITMASKLYITGLPFYLSERQLRSALSHCPLTWLSIVRSNHGIVSMVEVDSVEESQRLTEVLNQWSLNGQCKIAVIPCDIVQACTVED